MASSKVTSAARQQQHTASAMGCGEEFPWLHDLKRQLPTSGFEMPIVPHTAGAQALKHTCKSVIGSSHPVLVTYSGSPA